ncbi:hypothetical protein [Mycetocola zhadangensis]|uniref:Lipoprotein LpqB N-terminal domain-containing protein n=1 Tax=Mycetocola zhadangensis TaxID=1164595 RepID=A0A3L7ISX3_9MICO|nr:hypothetical protein [Mycetocola zhadangensis]RLQ81273.1 hypothetical protein D9V28_12935 [Mycetocola zhadangensis]GGF03172.1 hypothetical protein GCM10011313_27870 [Mycetocola zhadangensis]
MTSQPAARRGLGVLAILVGVLVIVSLIVVFTRGELELLDESTPEGVVQRYSAAVLDGDEDAALRYLAAEAQSDCGLIAVTETENLRVSLVSTENGDDGGSADVTVSLSRGSNGELFGGSGYEYEERFSLTKVGSDWRIETAPWELAFCRNDGFSG